MGLESASPAFIKDLNTSWPLGGDERSTSDDHHRLIKSALTNTFPEMSATVSANPSELNKLSGYTGAIPELGSEQAWSQQQYFAENTLTDTSSITWDLQIAQTAKLSIGGSRVLTNPSNMQAGATYIVRIVNQLSSTASISFGSAYLFPAGVQPAVTKSLSAIDIISFYCDGASMLGTALLDFK